MIVIYELCFIGMNKNQLLRMIETLSVRSAPQDQKINLLSSNIYDIVKISNEQIHRNR